MAQAAQHEMILPTLFGDAANPYQIRPLNFVCSLAIHAGAMALMFYLATVTVRVVQNPHASLSSLLSSPISLPPQLTRSGGGGGGGAHELLLASKGAPPKTSYEQIAPPTVHVAENPKLAVPATVIVPNATMPKAAIGDLKGVLGPASDGVGTGSGIGNGNGGGVGSGRGRGVGPGDIAGMGGGIYHVGGGVSSPRIIKQVDPEFSDEARKARYQGVVTIRAVIGPDGLVHDPKPMQSLGMGLDEKAIDALKQWRFDPAKKDGKPVAVYAILEVNFRLY